MPFNSSTNLRITVRPNVLVVIYNVFVDGWNSTPLLADDQQTPYGQEIVARGTGLIETGTAWNDAEAVLALGGNRALQVELEENATAANVFNYLSGQDDLGGPFVKIETTEIIGNKVALVRWEVTRRTSYGGEQTVV